MNLVLATPAVQIQAKDVINKACARIAGITAVISLRNLLRACVNNLWSLSPLDAFVVVECQRSSSYKHCCHLLMHFYYKIAQSNRARGNLAQNYFGTGFVLIFMPDVPFQRCNPSDCRACPRFRRKPTSYSRSICGHEHP